MVKSYPLSLLALPKAGCVPSNQSAVMNHIVFSDNVKNDGWLRLDFCDFIGVLAWIQFGGLGRQDDVLASNPGLAARAVFCLQVGATPRNSRASRPRSWRHPNVMSNCSLMAQYYHRFPDFNTHRGESEHFHQSCSGWYGVESKSRCNLCNSV
jgi:hypothetical protein